MGGGQGVVGRGGGGRGGWRVLPAGGIRASQGTFSSLISLIYRSYLVQ